MSEPKVLGSTGAFGKVCIRTDQEIWLSPAEMIKLYVQDKSCE